MLPQSNATLLRVAGGGTTEDFDAPAGADTDKWTGNAPVYVQERTERVARDQASDVVVERVVIAPASLPVEFAQGDTLTLDRGGEVVTEDVRAVARRELPGALGTVRLVLEDG